MAEEIEMDSDTVPEEGEVVVAKTKAKRATKRKPKAAALITGPGVTVIQNKFVDSYTGELCDNTVGIPGYEDVARFATLPTMIAYLEENCKSKEDYATLCSAVADKFEQLLPLVRAPPNVLLRSFGGKLDFSEYIADLAVWDALTAEKGENVEEYTKRTKGGGASKRTKKAAPASVTLVAGLAKIVHTSNTAAAVKVCNAADATLEKESKQKSTPASFIKSQNSFIAKTSVPDIENDKTKHPRFKRVLLSGNGYEAIALQPIAGILLDGEDAKTLGNHVASRLTGEQVYGPAVVFAQRKINVKL